MYKEDTGMNPKEKSESRAIYLRYEPNKTCIVLDHVGNARRHFPNGLPWDKIDCNYEGKSSKEKSESRAIYDSIKWAEHNGLHLEFIQSLIKNIQKNQTVFDAIFHSNYEWNL
jgi:hypothetical protein